ncbi:MAG: hypothetical protein M3297_01430 [Thermoproteota archaeon]|jgi:hypothetical protein|nr:hypothetical protein [Thermoproteota archaeon]
MASAPSSSRDRNRPKQFRCDICDKSFDSIEILNSHKNLDHSESGRNQSPAGVG